MTYEARFGSVAREVRSNLGKRVRISENKGRNRVDVTEGVITEIYPFFFMIRLDGNSMVSYQYADVFTKSIEMEVC